MPTASEGCKAGVPQPPALYRWKLWKVHLCCSGGNILLAACVLLVATFITLVSAHCPAMLSPLHHLLAWVLSLPPLPTRVLEIVFRNHLDNPGFNSPLLSVEVSFTNLQDRHPDIWVLLNGPLGVLKCCHCPESFKRKSTLARPGNKCVWPCWSSRGITTWGYYFVYPKPLNWLLK